MVSQSGGTWGKAKEVLGLGALNTGGDAEIQLMSCASAGNCSAGGLYLDGSRHLQVFVVGQVAGTWGKAEEIPGLATLNTGNSALAPVSCASPGNCRAGGYYTNNSGQAQAFVVRQVAGTWGTAKQVPGLAALNLGNNSAIAAVSCAPAGRCSAGGTYRDGSGNFQAFVVSQT